MRSLRPNDPWSIAAVLCLSGGGVLLLIAWYDISGTADLYRQMPYLVSAGFTGLALIMVGSALLVAGRSDRVERRLAQLLDAITEAVDGEDTAGGQGPQEPGADGEARSPAGSAGEAGSADPLLAASQTYLTVPEGTTYHRPGCLLLREKDARPADPQEISRGALSPCPVCRPEPPSESS